MDRQPDVTVIMPVHNGEEYLGQAIDSLASQTIGADRMQAILIDDGSTDGSPALLDRAAESHPFIEVTHQANSGGPAAPRNTALERVRGRYVFFLDQDDYLSDDALEALVRIADENGTDVVLARMKGVGGRSTPRAMFPRTVPRTDVHSSSAYWILNPLKLFRTELIRTLGLRFATDLPWGEDQPFVAMALLKADGISVLSDKDYVFWVFRDDRSNITTSVISLSSRMPVVDRMFDFVASEVPPGPERDRLMRRHFRIEMVRSAFEGYRTQKDPSQRAAAFARFRELVESYYTANVEAGMSPEERVLMRLIAEDRREEFGEYLDVLAGAGKPEMLVEGGSVFLALPGFREEGRGLPDELYEVGASLKVQSRLEPIRVDSSGAHIDAICRLRALTSHVTGVSLVIRPRGEGADVEVPLAFNLVREEVLPFVHVIDTVEGDALLRGLEEGTYDLFVRVAAGPVWRERRLLECAAPGLEPRVLRGSGTGRAARTGTLHTTSKGNLSLTVKVGHHALRRFVSRVRRLVNRVTAGA